MAHPSLSVIYVNQGDYAKGEAELELLLQRTRTSRAQQRPGIPLRRAGQEPREGRGDDPQGRAGENLTSTRLSRQPGLGPVQARQGQGSPGAVEEGRRAA